MMITGILTAILALLWTVVVRGDEECKCIPSSPCWPTASEWTAFNASINGKLIRNHPVGAPCYPGPRQNPQECAYRDTHATNNTFLQQFPLGYSYPIDDACPLLNVSAGEIPAPAGGCHLGDSPIYTVNATCVEDVQKGVLFARERNLRLVVRDTGHDLLGRSMGRYALQVWVRDLRTGVEVLDAKGEWGGKGKAVRIGGGYVWGDVYPIVAEKGLMVVGGGTPSVGCLGGWMQGGGHSPLTHDYGLGADQVLQAKIVLADGSLVTASPSQNQDLFFAIRGGGPGTYGIVVETIVKAYPTRSVVAQTLAFAPLDGNDTDTFFEALTDLYQALPELARGGWSGFGQWCVDCAVPPFANFSTGYTHSFANLGKDLPAAKKAFAPTLEKLNKYNGTRLVINVQYAETKDYAEYYNKYSGVEPPAGTTGATSSRFLDEPALLSSRSALKSTLRTTAGAKTQHTTNVLEFFGAPYGPLSRPPDPTPGVNPAWRSMILSQIVARYWTRETSEREIERIQHDLEFIKVAALRRLAPGTGTYMNEANRLDQEWREDFYGGNYRRLGRIKREVDPEGVFYCHTCVGSDEWAERDGRLCRK